MCATARYLVSELLAGNNGDLFTHALFGMEVIAHAHVVLLHDDPGCLLRSRGANTAHLGGSLVKELYSTS